MADVRKCGFGQRTSVRDALADLQSRIGPLETEMVAIDAAAGRVAAEDIHAPCAVPHFARSMMDGYAVVAESTLGATAYQPRPLEVVGEVRAGALPQLDGPLRSGQAYRVTTGAPVPEGSDAVLMAEHSEQVAEDRIVATQPVSRHKHVGRVGEDIAVGDLVVSCGRRLRPQDSGVIASVGIAEVAVVRQPSVTIIITGNELLAPGSSPHGAHIVDSNSVVLAALARRDGAGHIQIRRLRDDRDVISAALADDPSEVLLVSGGSSVGPEDHVPLVLAELGDLRVHGVAMRPSSPAGFGCIGTRQVFLLPGNPVSCMCAYEFFAGPAIRALGGGLWTWPHARVRLPVADKIVSVLGRTDFMRVTVDDDGVHPLMTSGASILSSTTRADGIVIVADEHEGHPAGDEVEVLLF